MGQHWLKNMEPPAFRCSSEGELQIRLTHTFNKSKPARTAHGTGRSMQGELSKLGWPSPLVPILRLCSNVMCRALCGMTDAGISEGVTPRQHLTGGTYTHRWGQVHPAGLPWESNQMLPRKELRPHTAGCMPVMGWLFPSREQVKQVSPHNRLQAEHKSRMLFQKAPWTALVIKSAVQSLGKTHHKFHFLPVKKGIEISSSL